MKKARNGIFETLISKIFWKISSSHFFFLVYAPSKSPDMPLNIMIIINYWLYLKREVINGVFDLIVSGFCCQVHELVQTLTWLLEEGKSSCILYQITAAKLSSCHLLVMLGTMDYYDPFNAFYVSLRTVSQVERGGGGGGVTKQVYSVPHLFLPQACRLSSFCLSVILFCPALLGTRFQCSPYHAVTGKIYYLKQHFLPPATAWRFTKI